MTLIPAPADRAFQQRRQQAAGGLRFDFTAERCSLTPECALSLERRRPLDEIPAGVHRAANLRRKAEADKNRT